MPNTEDLKTGSCLCGAVSYQVSGPLKAVVGCHCSLCRKSTGHFLAFTAAWHRDFRITSDRGLKWYHASEGARRGFCGDCGATLFFETLGTDKISIAAGTFDGATGLATAAHIFVADKGDYYALDDGAPQFPQGGDNVPMPD